MVRWPPECLPPPTPGGGSSEVSPLQQVPAGTSVFPGEAVSLRAGIYQLEKWTGSQKKRRHRRLLGRKRPVGSLFPFHDTITTPMKKIIFFFVVFHPGHWMLFGLIEHVSVLMVWIPLLKSYFYINNLIITLGGSMNGPCIVFPGRGWSTGTRFYEAHKSNRWWR